MMLRWSIAVMLILHDAPALAQSDPGTPDAMTQYRLLTSVAPKRCSRAASHDEIIVCGESVNRAPRLPYPDERNAPGERPGFAQGEVARTDYDPTIARHCPMRGCAGDGSLVGGIAKVLDRIRN